MKNTIRYRLRSLLAALSLISSTTVSACAVTQKDNIAFVDANNAQTVYQCTDVFTFDSNTITCDSCSFDGFTGSCATNKLIGSASGTTVTIERGNAQISSTCSPIITCTFSGGNCASTSKTGTFVYPTGFISYPSANSCAFTSTPAA